MMSPNRPAPRRFSLTLFLGLSLSAAASHGATTGVGSFTLDLGGLDPALRSTLASTLSGFQAKAAVDEAIKAFNFFYGQFNGSGNETKIKAAELATIVSFGGPGSADEAIKAFNFFYGQFNGSGSETKVKAAELAAQVGRAGQGSAAEAQRAFSFFYGKFNGSGNETKVKAAELAVQIITGDPEKQGRDANRSQLFENLQIQAQR